MDDKTAKIPSLKEFDKSNKHKTRRDEQTKKKSKSLKGDTHRVEIDRNKSKSSHYPAEEGVKTYTPRKSSAEKSGVSGSTQKIYGKKSRESSYENFERAEFKPHERRRSPSQQGLTQTRVAGRRPQGQASPQSRAVRQRVEEDSKAYQRPASSNVNKQRQQQQRSTHPSQKQHRGQRPTKSRASAEASRNQLRHKKRKKPKKPLSPFARKVRRIMIYALIVLAVLVAGIVLSMTVLFKTENIVVNVPDNFYSSQDIISASGLHYQDNIFTAGKSQASKRLMEKFPYIKEADVYAVMPDTINIDITLCTESYAVKTENITYVAGEDSKVLKVNSTVDEVQVPLVEGVQVKSAKVGEKLEFESDFVRDSLTEMFEFAKLKGYKDITAVDIETHETTSGTKTIEIRYVYDNRIVIFLGIPENLSYKMQTAHTIIDEKLDVNGAVLTGELDVSQCYDTNKSYFNQYSLIPEVVVTEPAATESQPTTAAEEYEYYDDGDYYDDSENYDDGEYYDDYEETYE